MKILTHEPDQGACTYYRVQLPAGKIVEQNPDTALAVWEANSPIDQVSKQVEDADIILLPRMLDHRMISFAEEMKKFGKKIVVDHDDNVFHVSPLSNHYDMFGVEDVILDMDGEKVELWKDGVNYDRKKNIKNLDNVKKGCEVADLITVTTPILASVYKQYNENVVDIPNSIDLTLWKKLSLIRTGRAVRMGWFGGSSHYEDLMILKNVLPVVFQKFPQLTFVYMGQYFGATFKGWERRVEFHPWVPTPAYPYKAAILDLDFAIIPLRESSFNECKSNIKWVEMSSLEIPSIVSYVSPYKEAYDGSNIVCVDNEDDAWIEGISQMMSLYNSGLGKKAYNTVSTSYNIDKNACQWYNTYKKLMEA